MKLTEEITKDAPSSLHARRQMMKVFYPVKEVPEKVLGRKKNTKDVDMVRRCSRKSHQNTLDVTVVTQESLRLDRVKVTLQWKYSLS